ncbi:hypothetical protein BC749_109106 [Flavobacterium araucananum]|uniref:AbiEi antitoxin C-terminal domain-containing protein n=1 Tax=Flavobacterium araucananum TaxID=946678 RepID=A0A227NK01_9FLAO|nr:DUF6088 family protein [Flavobacterium araucananum]OXE98103.1 hypothetical protein B0A64_22805 [Flavobacterium araucananum]PWJ96829.1 hypothetical protein BC749_109106 [Flavobacterium araucananum]
MKVTDKIERKIKQIAPGEVFGYDTLGLASNEVLAGAKALSRLKEKGVIRRARKGYYYKPKVSVFGEQKPREDVLLGLYLFDNNKQTAYVTGTRLYNRLGLTTQVPKSIRIASLDRQVKGKIGNLFIKPAKSYVKVTSESIRYLEILDVMKDFNTIPDLQKKDGLAYLKKAIRNLKNSEMKKLVTYGISYPPKVRALLGALLEDNTDCDNLKKLKKSINPASRYQYGFSATLLPTAQSWNIS